MELTGAAIVDVPPLLNHGTIARLRSDLDRALADRGPRAVLLLGGEESFCRGLDLAASADPFVEEAAMQAFAACLEIIRTGPKPVIALVRGAAVAGGVGLAAACDEVIATTEATFALTELLFGLTPAIILPYLAQRLRPQKLCWMGLTAQTVTADEALHCGLADVVCTPGKAPSALRGCMRRLNRVRPEAVALWKRMTIHPPAPGSGDGVKITSEALRDPAVREGFRIFLETGQLPWKKIEP